MVLYCPAKPNSLSMAVGAYASKDMQQAYTYSLAPQFVEGYTNALGHACNDLRVLPPQPISAESTPSMQSSVSMNTNYSPRSSFHSPRDAGSMAEWCAQLVCYLWFADPSRLPATGSARYGRQRSATEAHGAGDKARRPIHRPSNRGMEGTRSQSRVQLFPAERFYIYVRSVLRATQVSHSVIVVALLYIFRLRVRHPNLQGHIGSEYRLFLTSLVLANKFLDDHTYTNKTWSSVSRIPLSEISKMELQLWTGIGLSANVSEDEFNDWTTVLGQLLHMRQSDIQWYEWTESLGRMPSPVEAHISPHTPVRQVYSSPIESNIDVGLTVPPMMERPSKRKRVDDYSERHVRRQEPKRTDPVFVPEAPVAYAPVTQSAGEVPICDYSMNNGLLFPDVNIGMSYTNLLGTISPFTTSQVPVAPMPNVLSYYQLAAGYLHGIPAIRNCGNFGGLSPAVAAPGTFAMPWEQQRITGPSPLPLVGKDQLVLPNTHVSPGGAANTMMQGPWNDIHVVPRDSRAMPLHNGQRLLNPAFAGMLHDDDPTC